MNDRNVEPLVTIVIPTLNSAKTIENTLMSIDKLDYSNFEIIVVDGNSTDGTLDIVKRFTSKYNIRIIIESRRGRGVAYNRGILEARGKYVAFLDSDAMIATPGWVRNAVNIMEKDNKVGVVFTKVFSPPESKFIQKVIDTYLCKGFTTANGAIYRRDAVLKVGGFNENMNYMQEDELLFKLKRAGYTYYVNYEDKIYHFHRESIRAYVKQNMEAAEGAKLYNYYTGEKWIIKDSISRVAIFLLSVIVIAIAIFLHYFIILSLILLLSYLGLYLKVNKETCSQYKFSKYTILSPFMIYISIVSYSISFLFKKPRVSKDGAKSTAVNTTV
ncbi:glycosyltransferase family 2 protein [Stygiolobus caldivivus]|uniref:Glycosyltransferase 2-like domain-containing protein n=1 Tax=Stygiolobus caldivivus TaxID=2824673 RepID=A0A8D5U508_9CREN|nr:glycosyltransferase [Stygiolobus caldivivus]BCU69054.1 hypothetical protein KN1_03510 [Stygiolobus caldivivus]